MTCWNILLLVCSLKVYFDMFQLQFTSNGNFEKKKILKADLLCVIFREIQIEKKAVFVLYLIGINKIFKKSVNEIPLRYFLVHFIL